MTQKRAALARTGKKVSLGKGKKWLMAVDPYAEFDITPLREFTRSLAGTSREQVVAAYVLAPASFNWTGEFSGPWMKEYKPRAEEKLREVLPDESIVTTVVPCKESGVRASARALVRFAQKINAETIVITTHARSGLERLALGSFAETLILLSKIPVLVVNPSHPVPLSIKRILVPTDLTKHAEKYLNQNIAFAKQTGAEIVLFYKQPDPLDPIIQQGVYTLGGGWVSVQNFIDEELAAKRKLMAKLESAVSKRGLKVSSVMDSSPAGLIDAINTAADDKGVDLITVSTHAGPVSAAILGSVARGLVRSAKVPVLVRRY